MVYIHNELPHVSSQTREQTRIDHVAGRKMWEFVVFVNWFYIITFFLGTIIVYIRIMDESGITWKSRNTNVLNCFLPSE
jgi:hypothetical protein